MRARVLVVDDDPALAEMLGIVLRSEGFQPSFVADGERALTAFRDARMTSPSTTLLGGRVDKNTDVGFTTRSAEVTLTVNGISCRLTSTPAFMRSRKIDSL